jgi:hypothetical protein
MDSRCLVMGSDTRAPCAESRGWSALSCQA